MSELGYGSRNWPYDGAVVSRSSFESLLRGDPVPFAVGPIVTAVVRHAVGPDRMGALQAQAFGSEGMLVTLVQDALAAWDRTVTALEALPDCRSSSPDAAIGALTVAAMVVGASIGALAAIRGRAPDEPMSRPFAPGAFPDFVKFALDTAFPGVGKEGRRQKLGMDVRTLRKLTREDPGEKFHASHIPDLAERLSDAMGRDAEGIEVPLRWLAACSRVRQRLDKSLGVGPSGRSWVDLLEEQVTASARRSLAILAHPDYPAAELAFMVERLLDPDTRSTVAPLAHELAVLCDHQPDTDDPQVLAGHLGSSALRLQSDAPFAKQVRDGLATLVLWGLHPPRFWLAVLESSRDPITAAPWVATKSGLQGWLAWFHRWARAVEEQAEPAHRATYLAAFAGLESGPAPNELLKVALESEMRKSGDDLPTVLNRLLSDQPIRLAEWSGQLRLAGIPIFPTSPPPGYDDSFEAGVEAFGRGDFTEALARAGALLEKDPADPDAAQLTIATSVVCIVSASLRIPPGDGPHLALRNETLANIPVTVDLCIALATAYGPLPWLLHAVRLRALPLLDGWLFAEAGKRRPSAITAPPIREALQELMAALESLHAEAPTSSGCAVAVLCSLALGQRPRARKWAKTANTLGNTLASRLLDPAGRTPDTFSEAFLACP